MTILVQPQMLDPMVPFGPGSITGLLPTSIAGTNTTAAVTISAGAAADSTNQRLLTLANPYNWTVTSDYQGGSTLPNSSTIHFFLCSGTSGYRVWGHSGLTPTPPAGYNLWYRRIFSLTTDNNGALRNGTLVEAEGGSYIFWSTAVIQDVSTAALGASRALYALSVPSGIRLQPIVRAHAPIATQTIILMSPDEPDLAPTAATSAPGYDLGSNTNDAAKSYAGYLVTNTSAQIGARASTGSCTLYLNTRGWKDWRRN